MHRIISAVTSALVVGVLVAPLALHAQSSPADEAAVQKVVTTLFDGMRAKDTTKMRSTFAPVARLLSSEVRDGVPRVSEFPVAAWIASVGRATQTLDERILSSEVRVDGGLATAWTKYEFWANNTFSHCGYNAFQLARYPDGWKIIHIADSRRTEGCR